MRRTFMPGWMLQPPLLCRNTNGTHLVRMLSMVMTGKRHARTRSRWTLCVASAARHPRRLRGGRGIFFCGCVADYGGSELRWIGQGGAIAAVTTAGFNNTMPGTSQPWRSRNGPKEVVTDGGAGQPANHSGRFGNAAIESTAALELQAVSAPAAGTRCNCIPNPLELLEFARTGQRDGVRS